MDKPTMPQVRPSASQQPEIRSLEMVARVSRQIADILDLDRLLDYTVEILNQDFKYKYAAIFLTDADEATITLKAMSGAVADHAPKFPIDDSNVIGRVAATGEPLLLGNSYRYKDTIPGYLPIVPQSELAVPLVLGEEILGVIDLQSEAPHRFDVNDLFLVQTLAGQIAVTIENARLLEERDRRMAELAALNQIGMVITKHQNLDVILRDILRRINALFQIEAVSLMLMENERLHFAAAVGAGAEKIKSFTLKQGQGIAWSVVETQRTIRVDHVEEDARHFTDIDTALHFKTRSLLAVPIQLQNKILGVIEAVNRVDGHPFSRDDEVTLEFIASSIAVIIENARLFEEIEESTRLKSELMQNVSHELRMPLTFVRAYVELILESKLGELPAAVKEKLELVSQKASLIGKLVEGIISLHNLEPDSLVFEKVAICDLVSQARDRALVEAAKHNAQIFTDCLPDLPPIFVDFYRIEQVFDCLLDNAIKFSPPGAKVVISARPGQNMINFSVRDEGIGIPPDKIDKIFDRFYQVDGSTTRRYGGIGLGLAVVREVVLAHKGQVFVESQVSKGTTFTFSLPVYKNETGHELE